MKPLQKLRERPLSVAKLVASGNTNKEIAAKLFISVKTVEKHRQAINRYFRVNSAVGVVRALIRHKHLTMEEFLGSEVGDNIHHGISQVMSARKLEKETPLVAGMRFF